MLGSQIVEGLAGCISLLVHSIFPGHEVHVHEVLLVHFFEVVSFCFVLTCAVKWLLA